MRGGSRIGHKGRCVKGTPKPRWERRRRAPILAAQLGSRGRTHPPNLHTGRDDKRKSARAGRINNICKPSSASGLRWLAA